MKALLFAVAMAAAPLGWAHGEKSGGAKGIDYAAAEEHPFGRAADPEKAKRTVRIQMTDQMRFHPAEITVKRGEIVRFVPVNKGQVMHEMVLGRMQDLKAHAALMSQHPGMEHDEPHMAHVAPGKTAVMGWQFTRAGEFFYGCLIPGHFEAGMIGKVRVIP